jgi:hypothetical protein
MSGDGEEDVVKAPQTHCVSDSPVAVWTLSQTPWDSSTII